jgi:hypothetical protein
MINQILSGVPLPRMIKVRQRFPRPVVSDVAGAVRAELHRIDIAGKIKPGDRVALTAGSRGIRNIVSIIREVVSVVKEAGGVPFIVPTMGSHGGATAQGQVEVLESLGITEKSVGAPIRATMDVVEMGMTEEGVAVSFDRYAATEAEAVVVIGRVKAHTSFRGNYESGLAKMIAIGLGKQQGAAVCHATGLSNMSNRIEQIARLALAKTHIIAGLALVENAYDETCHVEAMAADKILSEEPRLLQLANDNMPRIQIPAFDVLVVDEIGKNISGTGMDPNIIGRFTTDKIPDRHFMQRIAVLDLTEGSHGNACGAGLADVCSQKLYDKFSFEQTYPNPLTSRIPLSGKMPMVMPNDKLAIQAAIKTCWDTPDVKLTMVRIKNTLHLEEIYISETLLSVANESEHLEIIGRPEPWSFDSEGNVGPF